LFERRLEVVDDFLVDEGSYKREEELCWTPFYSRSRAAP